jgi:hypothetical protein
MRLLMSARLLLTTHHDRSAAACMCRTDTPQTPPMSQKS